jgi:GNAT superfamily N-acetyltransferase
MDGQDAATTSWFWTQDAAAIPVGRFHTVWREDVLTPLPALPGLSIAPAGDVSVAGALSSIDTGEIARRFAGGHRPWLARLAGEPVGWGWCAAEEFSIGELGISCSLPPGNRYLWDFFTVPHWRGRGIYPRLLQTIVARESDVERFWLGHDLDNVASARGIAKAGFREVGVLYRRQNGEFALVPSGPPQRAVAASALFGVPVADPFTARGIRSIR